MTIATVLLLVRFVGADEPNRSWQIYGRVVDEAGAPVEDFVASTFWPSFGKLWNETPELLEERPAERFGNDEGFLAPSPNRIAKRQPGGQFTLSVDGLSHVSIFAIDGRRERGGIALGQTRRCRRTS